MSCTAVLILVFHSALLSTAYFTPLLPLCFVVLLCSLEVHSSPAPLSPSFPHSIIFSRPLPTSSLFTPHLVGRKSTFKNAIFGSSGHQLEGCSSLAPTERLWRYDSPVISHLLARRCCPPNVLTCTARMNECLIEMLTQLLIPSLSELCSNLV